jgi:hypothetical protein
MIRAYAHLEIPSSENYGISRAKEDFSSFRELPAGEMHEILFRLSMLVACL